MSEVEVLLETIAVDVVELHEMKAGRFVAGVEKAEAPIGGDDVERPRREVRERVVEKIDAADDARRALLAPGDHVRARERELSMLVAESRRDLPQVEEALVAQIVVEEEARRPKRRVREERTVEL